MKKQQPGNVDDSSSDEYRLMAERAKAEGALRMKAILGSQGEPIPLREVLKEDSLPIATWISLAKGPNFLSWGDEPLPLLVSVAARLLRGTDFHEAAFRASKLIDACHLELLRQQDVYHTAKDFLREVEETGLDGDKSISFLDGIRAITKQDRLERAQNDYERLLTSLRADDENPFAIDINTGKPIGFSCTNAEPEIHRQLRWERDDMIAHWTDYHKHGFRSVIEVLRLRTMFSEMAARGRFGKKKIPKIFVDSKNGCSSATKLKKPATKRRKAAKKRK